MRYFLAKVVYIFYKVIILVNSDIVVKSKHRSNLATRTNREKKKNVWVCVCHVMGACPCAYCTRSVIGCEYEM